MGREESGVGRSNFKIAPKRFALNRIFGDQFEI
jgi:hypothetical protein